MKRIDVLYDGVHYSIGQEDYDAVKAAVTAAANGESGWITVNRGEGRPQPAELLVGPGIPIALLPIIPEDVDRGAPEDDHPGAPSAVNG